jgi:hypothetical protein
VGIVTFWELERWLMKCEGMRRPVQVRLSLVDDEYRVALHDVLAEVGRSPRTDTLPAIVTHAPTAEAALYAAIETWESAHA